MKLYAKRVLSTLLVLCMCMTMLPTMKAEAATPNYAVSSSYQVSTYYTALCNVTLTGNQRADIVNVALSQVGYREGSYSGDYGGADDGSYNNYTEYNYWYHNYVSSGMPVGGDSAPWCATFVSWCAEQANIPTSILKRSTAAGHGTSYFDVNFYSGSSTLASSGDNDSYFMGYNYTPQMGDLFFTRSWSHVGLVVGVSGNYVITVEGNTNNNGSSQGNGVYKLTWRKITDLYFGVPNYTNIKHTVDASYGMNFTAYPKAKITAENIFDAYHSQIDSTSWIGTSDKCTIHEVYTDGCCKVTYPLDAGGTKTVYSKIALFNTHTHSYTGARVYENAHPHRISRRCVDYATCGGWIWTDEYYEVKTCEQCWHADFDIGASSISVKVGESKTVSATVSGCLPNSAVLYRALSPDNDIVEVTIEKQQVTFTGLKAGTTNFSLTVYSDSSKARVIGTITIPVTVTAQTYTVSYNANGGIGAPSDQTKYHGTSLTLSATKPTRTGYTFLGWSTSSISTSTTYQPGDSYSDNSNITLYAVWKKGCESNSHSYSFMVSKTPTTSATGMLTGTCSKCSGTTTVTLPKLSTTDYNYKVTKEPSYTAAGTARYTWKTTTYGTFYFDVTLDKLTATLTKMEVATKPTKTVYEIGESLDTTGLTLKATYSDGSTKTITSGFATSGFDSSTAGEKTVTVSYGGKSTTLTVTVIAPVPDTDTRLTVGRVNARVGETVEVTLTLENAPKIRSIGISNIRYDKENLTLVSGEWLITGTTLANWNSADKAAVAAYTSDTDLNGAVFKLIFRVNDDAEPGTYEVSCSVTARQKPEGSAESAVKIVAVPGVIAVKDYLIGDVNDDGAVDTDDSIYLLYHTLFGDSSYPVNQDCDFNGDGAVDTDDAIYLLYHTLFGDSMYPLQ